MALLRPMTAACEASVMAMTCSGCDEAPACVLRCASSGDTVLMDLQADASHPASPHQ